MKGSSCFCFISVLQKHVWNRSGPGDSVQSYFSIEHNCLKRPLILDETRQLVDRLRAHLPSGGFEPVGQQSSLDSPSPVQEAKSDYLEPWLTKGRPDGQRYANHVKCVQSGRKGGMVRVANGQWLKGLYERAGYKQWLARVHTGVWACTVYMQAHVGAKRGECVEGEIGGYCKENNKQIVIVHLQDL